MLRPWPILLLALSPCCQAQLTGSFSLDRATYAPGEPVVLSFTLHNDGDEAQDVHTADPYSFCSGYAIHVKRDDALNPSCFQGFAGSCMGGVASLAPGATRTEHILLNYPDHSSGDLTPPVKAPGSYTIEASREITAGPWSQQSPSLQVQQTLKLRIDNNLEVSPAAYLPYVQQLTSSDIQVRIEAARTLATLAPHALEPLLLTFATSKETILRQFAPLALANLATPASLAALADMLLHATPGSYEFMTAAELLGRTHDPAWLPLLLEVADQHGPLYLCYAGESGGDAAVAPLLGRLRSTDADTRAGASQALGCTGSRQAIPLLIALLGPQPNNDTATAISMALTELTHVEVDFGSVPAASLNLQARWQSWWLRAGETATVYKPGVCVSNTLLP